MQGDHSQDRSGPLTLRWWVTDRHGRVVLGQAPNPAIVVWLVSVAARWLDVLDGEREDTLRLVGAGALVVWGLDELVRGSSPFRRVLGAIVLGFQLVRLFG